MTLDEIADRVRRRLSGFVEVRDLPPVPPGFRPHSELQPDPHDARRAVSATGVWSGCPCGATDHLGFRPFRGDGTLTGHTGTPADVITCFVTGKQWLVRTAVAAVLRDEEQAYLDLLAQAERIVPKVVRRQGASAATLAYLYDTHGIPAEVAATFFPPASLV